MKKGHAAGSGASMPEPFATYDHDSSSWRTSALSLFGGLHEFSETWPRSGTMRNGKCYRRPPWVRPIDGNGSGSWPTANARDWKDTPGMALDGTNPDGSHRDRTDLLLRKVYEVERRLNDSYVSIVAVGDGNLMNVDPCAWLREDGKPPADIEGIDPYVGFTDEPAVAVRGS